MTSLLVKTAVQFLGMALIILMAAALCVAAYFTPVLHQTHIFVFKNTLGFVTIIYIVRCIWIIPTLFMDDK